MIGDPTEVGALGPFFAGKLKQIYIGSVKTNIGHLEAAAGVAALIKVLLMMHHGKIVPSLWYTKENENPKLKLHQYGFVVPTSCIPWDIPQNRPRMACINGFGFGGTNAHAIVTQYRADRQHITRLSVTGKAHFPPILTISDNEATGLQLCTQNVCDHLEEREYNLTALSCTSTCHRDHRPVRKAFIAKSQTALINQCRQFISEKAILQKCPDKKHIVFVFCGVGTTWKNMAKWLLTLESFAKQIDHIDRHLSKLTGWKIKNKLKNCDDTLVSDPMVVHIGIFSYQLGLVEVWKHFGVKPDAVVGQSVGEVAAAYVAGIYDLETAVHIIFHRSKVLASVTTGSMAIVKNIDVKTVDMYCESMHTLNVAVYSSPRACVVSGEENEFQQMQKHLSDMTNGSSKVIFLDVNCAYHSQLVEQAAEALGSDIGKVSALPASIPLYSTVTGQTMTNGLFDHAEYWVKNVRMPVQFSKAIQASKSKSNSTHTIYVEIGPSPVLIAHILDILPNAEDVSTVVSVRRNAERDTFANAVCKLYEHGVDLTWANIVPCQGPPTDIPTYNGQKVKGLYQCQTFLQATQAVRSSSSTHPFILLKPSTEYGIELEACVNQSATDYVYQHIIGGQNILPGAYYAEIGYVLNKTVLGYSGENTVISLEFLQPVMLTGSQSLTFNITSYKQDKKVMFHVHDGGTVSCKGNVSSFEDKTDGKIALVDLKSMEVLFAMSTDTDMSKDQIYKKFHSLGFSYGESFQLIQRLLINGRESLSEIEVPDEIMAGAKTLTFHPCVLDAMLQTTILTGEKYFIKTAQAEKRRFLPVAMEGIHRLKRLEKHMFVYTKLINITVLETVFHLHYNILLTDAQGSKIAEIRNCTTNPKSAGLRAPSDLKYELTWQTLEIKSSLVKSANVFLLSSSMSLDEPNKFPESVVTVYQGSHISPQSYVEQAFKAVETDVDVIVFFVESKTIDSDVISTEGVLSLYNTVNTNCQLLIELLRYLRNNGINKHLYIVTENTQIYDPSSQVQLNCNGAELWGLIRSANTEFIADMTLVDVQPSLIECKIQLFDFIGSSKELEVTPPEILITRDKIMASDFIKTPRYVPTPVTRITQQQILKGSHQIIARCTAEPRDISVMGIPDRQFKRNDPGVVRLQVTSVSLPPNSTILHGKAMPIDERDVWIDSDPFGQQLYATEYKGYVTKDNAKNSSCKCGASIDLRDGHSADELESVVLYPAKVYTEMHVPKKLVVSMKDIPFYQPGLLYYSLTFWAMATKIPSRSNVFVYFQNTDEIPYLLLERMLQSTKHAKVKWIHDAMEINESDILITLEKVRRSLNVLQSFKLIISLEGHLTKEVSAALNHTNHRRLVILRKEEIFNEDNISKELKRVVKWLTVNKDVFPKQKHQQTNFGNSENCAVEIPCRTVQIINEHSQILIPIKKPLGSLFDRTSVYVVTGGLSGLGWELTKLMAEMGAGTIATITRNHATSEKKNDIQQLERLTKCKIICLIADVSDVNSLRKSFVTLKALTSAGLVKGIFHCAGVSRGGLIMDISMEDVEFVLKPKVLGTLNLHLVVAEFGWQLEYFVLASSISSLVGSLKQSNYGAANAFLDVFASWRRQHGLPGQSINWGALSTGMAASQEFAKMFVKRGFNLLPVNDVRCCFQACLLQNSSRVVFADINWDAIAVSMAGMKRVQLQFKNVINEAVTSLTKAKSVHDKDEWLNLSALRQEDPKARYSAVLTFVRVVTCKVLGCDPDQTKLNMTFAELPFDSITIVTLINVIHQRTGYRIPTMFMLDSSHTLSDLADHLNQNVFYE